MAAILRVKRRNSVEPQDAFLIACKKRKISETDPENDAASPTPLTAVVKFAATVNNQDNDVIKHVAKSFNKDTLKVNYKQHTVDITSKVRQRTKQESAENRYKVVNYFRSLNQRKEDNLSDDVTTVIDIENLSAKVADKDKSDNYVYDLYYMEAHDDMLLDHLVSVYPINQDIIFDLPTNEEEENIYESEDSNSESNWRNDYPDSDHSENSITENDMRQAMSKINLRDEDSNIDSDDDEEDFVYGLDKDDVDRYGYKYAKYKTKIKNEMCGINNDDDDDDDNDSYGDSTECSENEECEY